MLVHNLFLSVIPATACQVQKHAFTQSSLYVQLTLVLWLQRNQQGEIQYFTPAEEREGTVTRIHLLSIAIIYTQCVIYEYYESWREAANFLYLRAVYLEVHLDFQHLCSHSRCHSEQHNILWQVTHHMGVRAKEHDGSFRRFTGLEDITLIFALCISVSPGRKVTLTVQ